MDWIESFRILQIEPTNDKKIKIAYSKLLKKYRAVSKLRIDKNLYNLITRYTLIF